MLDESTAAYVALGLAALAWLFVIVIWFQLRSKAMAVRVPPHTAYGPRFQVQLAAETLPAGTPPSEALFFRDSEVVALDLNERFAQSLWSFEDDRDLKFDAPHSASRRILIRYGQTKTGYLDVSAENYASPSPFKKTVTGVATAKLAIVNPRHWSFGEIQEIASSVAAMIEGEDQLETANRYISDKAIAILWSQERPSEEGSALKLSFMGRGLAAASVKAMQKRAGDPNQLAATMPPFPKA